MTSSSNDNEYVTVSRINDAEAQNPIILKVTANHIAHALGNHIASTKAILESDFQGLTVEDLKQYRTLYMVDTLNKIDVNPIAGSFNTPFIKQVLADTIAYGVEETSVLDGIKYTKYAFVALIAFFTFSFISVFAMGKL